MSSNAMVLVRRRPKVVLALTFIIGLIFISWSTPTKDIRAHTQRIIKKVPFATTPYTFKGQAVLEHAHLLEDADDFLEHFKAVVQYPSMPIADAKAGCGWPHVDDVNFQFSYDASRGEDLEWIIKDVDDYKIELRRKQWQYFVSNEMRPWSEHKKKFSGRGIVIPAGHEKSIHRLKIILRMLKKLGSRIPVEIAYWGEHELLHSNVTQELLDIRPDLYFNDLSAEDQPTTYYFGMMNFRLKIPAILNSRFAEVILLDSDNIPVIDPEELFESAEYKEYGTIFWPDIARTRKQNPMWAITNTRCRMDEFEFESGQLLVDKRKYWYHLQLATWFETEHGLFYNNLLLGDKDMFRFAWHALKTKFGTPARWITSVGTLSPGKRKGDRKIFCGHTFAQHHPDKDGKVAFLHGGLLKTLHPEAITWQLENQGGIFQAYKRMLGDHDKMLVPFVDVSWDQAYYLDEEDKSPAYMPAYCTDFPMVRALPLDNLVPGFQETYKELGGYWMVQEWFEELENMPDEIMVEGEWEEEEEEEEHVGIVLPGMSAIGQTLPGMKGGAAAAGSGGQTAGQVVPAMKADPGVVTPGQALPGVKADTGITTGQASPGLTPDTRVINAQMSPGIKVDTGMTTGQTVPLKADSAVGAGGQPLPLKADAGVSTPGQMLPLKADTGVGTQGQMLPVKADAIGGQSLPLKADPAYVAGDQTLPLKADAGVGTAGQSAPVKADAGVGAAGQTLPLKADAGVGAAGQSPPLKADPGYVASGGQMLPQTLPPLNPGIGIGNQLFPAMLEAEGLEEYYEDEEEEFEEEEPLPGTMTTGQTLPGLKANTGSGIGDVGTGRVGIGMNIPYLSPEVK